MAPMFLGVDGGGTKTAYVLIDAHGELRASHVGGSVSHLSEGFERAEALLVQGVRAVLAAANVRCLTARLRVLRAAIARRGQRHHFATRRTSARRACPRRAFAAATT
jgi:N-acetylglucosamine kinase-like BadF-type ATPase